MKYAPHLPPALKNVSFSLKSGDKVGVVGRTGSGKSTLLLALYRMFNLEMGSITYDGIDISSLSLLQLRRGLSVIPQVQFRAVWGLFSTWILAGTPAV
jgi:ATP-binding cassette subfamily C (CFTR/MRP) protein 1